MAMMQTPDAPIYNQRLGVDFFQLVGLCSDGETGGTNSSSGPQTFLTAAMNSVKTAKKGIPMR